MKKLAVLGPKGIYTDKVALKLKESYQIEEKEACSFQILGFYNLL